MRSDKALAREPIELQDVPFSAPFDTIRKGHRIVSSKTGILRRFSKVISYPGDAVCHAFGILPCDATRFSLQNNTHKSGGAGLSAEAALAATLGEAVERYCMLFYDKRDMVLARARDLGELAVAPKLLSLYTRDQIAGRKARLSYFDEDTVIRWVWGYSLTRERWCLVPACQVYLNYRCDEDETVIASNASSGLAAGNTLEEAVLSGLSEVLERDAFTLAWLYRRIARRVRIDDSELAGFLEEHFHANFPAVDISIFDVTLDIPVFCAFVVMRRPAEFGPVMLVGSAARLNAKDAITKSLIEAGQEISYVRYLMSDMQGWYPADDFANITTFDEHFMVYNKRSELIAEAFAFCRDVSETTGSSSLPQHSTGRPLGDIRKIVGILAERGYETILVDITTPDIQDVGLHVVRVMVPGLVPLHGNHNWPFLGVPRLHEIPRRMGWRRPDEPGGAATLNPFPHPFP